MLRIILTIIQVFSAACIIGLVLLQRGKGAEAGAGFGAGASGTVFGARGVGTALSRSTAIFAAIFMINSLALAYMGTRTSEQPKTILDVVGESKKAPAPTNGPLTAPSPSTAPPAATPNVTPGAPPSTSPTAGTASAPATSDSASSAPMPPPASAPAVPAPAPEQGGPSGAPKQN